MTTPTDPVVSTETQRLTPAVQRVIDWHRQHDDAARQPEPTAPADDDGSAPAAEAAPDVAADVSPSP